uniref:Wsv271-like protein n=1 Tax=Trachysalambria curvirostris majanivirus TaxID=2984281 RepID=A0A9C7BWJ7_9VIRU|nr:MAG: wsv271-like protein [Trachysalambria curvirostris majanivirus]
MRHTTSGDSNIIPFLEQEIKKQNSQLTNTDIIRTVKHFKTDLINIFCLPIMDILSSLKVKSDLQIDIYLAILSFVESEYSISYLSYKDFSEENFKTLVHDINFLYLNNCQDTKIKKSITMRELEAIKREQLISNKHTKYLHSPRLASNIYFRNETLLSKLPIKVESIYKIASFLSSIKSIEEKSIFCKGIFAYVTFLLKQCLINDSCVGYNYYQNLQDLDKNHSLLTDSLFAFEKRFKKRLKQIKRLKHNKRQYCLQINNGTIDYSDDDNDDEEEEEERNEEDDHCYKYGALDYNVAQGPYAPIQYNNENNKYYLASGMFSDDSILGKKLISLVEEGDTYGIRQLTNYVLSINGNNYNTSPFLIQYINSLVDVITVQGERLRNLKIFNYEPPISNMMTAYYTLPPLAPNKRLDLLKDSKVADDEIKKSSITLKYEGNILSKIDDIISNYNKKTNLLTFFIDNIYELKNIAFDLFTDIFKHLLNKTQSNDNGDYLYSYSSTIERLVTDISPFGPISDMSKVIAIETVSIKNNNNSNHLRAIHPLNGKQDKNLNMANQSIMMINTAIERSLQDKVNADKRKKILLEAKLFLENNGADFKNLIMVNNKNRDTATNPYDNEPIFKGLLIILAMTMHKTKLVNFNNEISTSSTYNKKDDDKYVLMIIPEVLEWLVEYLYSQIETAMSSIVATKLPSDFADRIYEENKLQMMNTNTGSEIGKLLTLVMADDYLKQIDNVLKAPQSDIHKQTREKLIHLVVDKSVDVLKKQCWGIIFMALMITIDSQRDLVLVDVFPDIDKNLKQDMSNILHYINNLGGKDKKHIKDVICALCLSTAKGAALSFARLSNTHFRYILSRFYTIKDNNNRTLQLNGYQISNKQKNRYNTITDSNNDTGNNNKTIDNKGYKKRPSSIKRSNIDILDSIINGYKET